MFPGVMVGLKGWERSHSQGAGLGNESSRGILYAPPSVNQKLQGKGIERFLAEFFKVKTKDTELWLLTETTPWPGTRRLKSIVYRLDAKRGSVTRRLFEASISVENKKDNPGVQVTASPYGDFEDFLPPLPDRRQVGKHT